MSSPEEIANAGMAAARGLNPEATHEQVAAAVVQGVLVAAQKSASIAASGGGSYPPDHPLMVSFAKWASSPNYAQTKHLAQTSVSTPSAQGPVFPHTDGTLWAAFAAGYKAHAADTGTPVPMPSPATPAPAPHAPPAPASVGLTGDIHADMMPEVKGSPVTMEHKASDGTVLGLNNEGVETA